MKQMGVILDEHTDHAIAAHKDFNAKDFTANSVNLMKNFAQTFISKIKEGLDFVNAQKSTVEYMLLTFNQTTSVNNLSFNDFSVLLKHSDDPTIKVTNGAESRAMRNTLNSRFNNSTELSAELKALLK